MSQLLQNSLYIPEDDLYLVSLNRHDFNCHTLRDSKKICIDGGKEYCRRAGDLFELDEAGRYIECCLMDDQPFEYIADRLLWGSAGKDGTQPMTFRPIKEWAHKPDGENHLKAILLNCPKISIFHKRVIEYWLARLEEEKTQVQEPPNPPSP